MFTKLFLDICQEMIWRNGQESERKSLRSHYRELGILPDSSEGKVNLILEDLNKE